MQAIRQLVKWQTIVGVDVLESLVDGGIELVYNKNN